MKPENMKIYNLWKAPCYDATGADITLKFNDKVLLEDVKCFACYNPSIVSIKYLNNRLYFSTNAQSFWIYPNTHNKVSHLEQLGLSDYEIFQTLEIKENEVLANFKSRAFSKPQNVALPITQKFLQPLMQ